MTGAPAHQFCRKRIPTNVESSEIRGAFFPVCAPCVYTYPVSYVAIIGPISPSNSKFLVRIWENHRLGHLGICCLPSSQHRSWRLVLVCSGNECELISDGFWKEPIKSGNQQNSNALSQMPLFPKIPPLPPQCAKLNPSLLFLTLPAPSKTASYLELQQKYFSYVRRKLLFLILRCLLQ